MEEGNQGVLAALGLTLVTAVRHVATITTSSAEFISRRALPREGMFLVRLEMADVMMGGGY